MFGTRYSLIWEPGPNLTPNTQDLTPIPDGFYYLDDGYACGGVNIYGGRVTGDSCPLFHKRYRGREDILVRDSIRLLRIR